MDDMLENAQHLRIEGSKLKGVLRNQDGGWHNAELDLDKWIGNSDGRLTWFGTNFSNNATNIGIQRERYLPELVATLRRDDGTEVANQHLLLGERIENMDGNFMVREREPPRQRREGLMEEDPFWRQNMSLGV